jgi:hypothetical protein
VEGEAIVLEGIRIVRFQPFEGDSRSVPDIAHYVLHFHVRSDIMMIFRTFVHPLFESKIP